MLRSQGKAKQLFSLVLEQGLAGGMGGGGGGGKVGVSAFPGRELQQARPPALHVNGKGLSVPLNPGTAELWILFVPHGLLRTLAGTLIISYLVVVI